MRLVSNNAYRRAATLAATAALLVVAGCSDSTDNPGGTPVPSNTAKATAVPSVTNTPKPTNTLGANTPTPTATATGMPDTVPAGDYSASIPLNSGRTANLNVTVDESGDATGTLEIVGTASSAAAIDDAAATVGAISGSVSLGFVSVSFSVDPSTGEFHFGGNIAIDGLGTPFDISGTLPLSPGATGSVSATVAGETFGPTTLSVGAGPTPLPTPNSSPTPITEGCAHGSFQFSVSNVSGGSNLTATGSLTLGKVVALDSFEPVTSSHVWTITADPCTNGGLNDIRHALIVQGIGMPNGIVPGTYQLATGTPPFLNLVYEEARFNPLDPGNNFLHAWGTTGGTFVITDAGGGALQVHVTGSMATHPLLGGGTGTFDFEVTGTITQIGA